MYELNLKDGTKLTYDEVSNKLLVNGLESNDWKPSFIENGDDEPSFFGFVNMREKLCYDIYKNVSRIYDESDLEL